jgi:hypothetical protein
LVRDTPILTPCPARGDASAIGKEYWHEVAQSCFWTFVSLFTFGTEVAVLHAADAPKDNKGYSTSKTTVVELGPEFPGMDGAS